MSILKSVLVTLIAGFCLIICVIIGADGLVEMKRSGNNNGISVTGSASTDFTSDLIVWRGSFTRQAQTTKEAYELLKTDAGIIKAYLTNNGIPETEFTFSSVSIHQNFRSIYNSDGYFQEQVPDGYTLSQNVAIESSDVDKVEGISRDITQVIDSGVAFFSESPEYYYTKLDELKLEMIAKATENARSRAEIVATEAKSSLGKLLTANLGVFQIVAQNSAAEDYSYGGTFNTWSKNKTASVTVKLFYTVE